MPEQRFCSSPRFELRWVQGPRRCGSNSSRPRACRSPATPGCLNRRTRDPASGPAPLWDEEAPQELRLFMFMPWVAIRSLRRVHGLQRPWREVRGERGQHDERERRRGEEHADYNRRERSLGFGSHACQGTAKETASGRHLAIDVGTHGCRRSRWLGRDLLVSTGHHRACESDAPWPSAREQ